MNTLHSSIRTAPLCCDRLFWQKTCETATISHFLQIQQPQVLPYTIVHKEPSGMFAYSVNNITFALQSLQSKLLCRRVPGVTLCQEPLKSLTVKSFVGLDNIAYRAVEDSTILYRAKYSGSKLSKTRQTAFSTGLMIWSLALKTMWKPDK